MEFSVLKKYYIGRQEGSTLFPIGTQTSLTVLGYSLNCYTKGYKV